jgi:eukaryotic-like serine/threonine-protein kinase
MNSEKWEKAKNIFNEALEKDTAARQAFLNEACNGDRDLRAEVESLLASAAGANRFFEGSVIADVLKLVEGEPGETLVGRRVGPYTLIKEIGRGGMGAVYLAARADAEFKKYVAIKLIKRGMDSEDILRRFRNERQILASLNHPNIARLLDGGTTDDGLPFFVMDYLEGQPLTDYCDSHKLTIHERLNLFREICAAVQHAHQNLVVHRDLKPSNILITAEGTPKLLDFGIAKFLNPTLAPQTIAPTATMMRMMTRDYASPEQVRGEPITTASDIYSLGV